MRFKYSSIAFTLFALTLVAAASDTPAVTQIGQLNPSTVYDNAYFGIVAISDSTIAVASLGDGYTYGTVYVYVKPAGGWTTMSPTAQLSTTLCCNNGSPLSISADGSTILAAVSSAGFGGGGTSQLYVRPPSGWQGTVAPTATLGGGLFSPQQAISPDGKTIVTTDGFGWSHKSYLYIFNKPASGWTSMKPSSTVLVSDTDGSSEAVAINSLNTIAVTHSPDHTVKVYQRSAGGIQLVATLTASDSASGGQLCCALTMDKQTIVVGGFNSSLGADSVYVFRKPAGGWADATETAQLNSPTPGDNLFGGALGLSGKAIVVGGFFTSAAYLYLEPADGWQTTSQPNYTFLSTDPYQEFFGQSVAILNNTILVGDIGAGAISHTGDAFIYQMQ